ncbi:MAG: hypothetical protein A9Z00_00800 [Thermobacillus sp. ZCTH02-B1]|uniref:hypothetical protein n=1 Tax=Thermobacillus sp. ZCTH02-B1 TaxID=1858795 RepID=UPI000B56AD8C|nr:hypothetical protein [Thermobacillus sp. ZCTH02-B1]OUM94192.1 MAG: hypothetical protein A9Z00_00800 [Thermobacillus sp. ZCTH02-B1]
MEPFERGRLLLKLMLVLARDRRAMQGRIQTTGFVREYGELPPDLGVMTLGRLGDDEIAALAESVGIRPAPAGAKCDIFMNGYGYRIESLAAYPPVIIDDVEPDGLAAACRLAGIPADRLGERLEACRQAAERRSTRAPVRTETGAIPGAIGPAPSESANAPAGPAHAPSGPAAGREDDRPVPEADGGPRPALESDEIRIADPDSPLKDDREWLAPLIEYFWFTGSERGRSHFPADYLLDFDDPLNMNTWRTFDKRYAVEAVWDRLAIRIARVGRDGAPREAVRIRVV